MQKNYHKSVNRLIVIEVKHWLGRLYEQDCYFIKEKDDRWTGEVHEKELKSPFGQVKRQVYLLKEQTKSNPWSNTIVFFADAEYVETGTSLSLRTNLNK